MDEAKRLGFDMVFQNANGDEKLQMQQGENLITQGVDLIVILHRTPMLPALSSNKRIKPTSKSSPSTA